MAEQVEVEIKVSSNIGEAAGDVTSGIDSIKSSAKEAQASVVDMGESTDGAIQLIDEGFGGIGTRIKNVYKGATALGKNFVASFKAGIAGANGMKKALVASGIGALVVALGLIVAYWDDILGLVNGVSSAQKDQLAAAEANVAAQEEASEMLSLQENSLRLQGKSEREIRDLKIQQTNETIAALEAQLETQKQIKKSQVEAANRNKAILQGIIRFVTAPITLLLAGIDAVGKAFGKDFGLEEGFSGGIAGLVFDPDEVAAEGDAAIKETEKKLAQLKNTRDGYLVANQNEEKVAAKSAQDARDKAGEEQLRKQQELQNKLLESEANYQKQLQDTRDKFDELVLSQQVSAEQQEINAVYDKFFALEEAYANNAEELAQIEAQRNKELAAINDKYRKEEADAQQEDLDRQKAYRQQIKDLAVDSVMSTFSSLKELNSIYDKDSEEAAKRAFMREKALSLAETIVSTYSSAQKAYASQLIPGDPTSVVRAQIAAGVAIAGGLARAATIASQKFQSSSESSTVPSAPSAPSVQGVSPQFNIVGQGGTNQLAQSIGAKFDQPIRAFVVGGDVTTSQELERKRIKTATFG